MQPTFQTRKKKFRKFLTTGPIYREPGSINIRKTYLETYQALEACIKKMPTKNKLDTETLTPWRESDLTMVTEKNKKLS